MGTMSGVALAAIAALVAAALAWADRSGTGQTRWMTPGRRSTLRGDPVGNIRARAPMTPNELGFHAVLRGALPEMLVLAQVSFGALLEPYGLREGTSEWWRVRNRFGQKVADYVILRPDGRVVCVIELDDRTHVGKSDEARDAMLLSAGVPVLRYRSGGKPDAAMLRRDLGLTESARAGRRR